MNDEPIGEKFKKKNFNQVMKNKFLMHYKKTSI